MTARVLCATDRAPGTDVKDDSAPDLNTPGFEPVTQWSEVECCTIRPNAPPWGPFDLLVLKVLVWGHLMNLSQNYL